MSSTQDQAAAIIEKGQEAAADKGQKDPLTLDDTEQATNKILKSATAALNKSDNPLKGPAASAAAKKDTPLANEVRNQVGGEVSGKTETGNQEGDKEESQHERVAQQLVDGARERLERMPFEKVKANYADPNEPSEDIAKRLLKEGGKEIGKNALKGKDFKEGEKGSGIVAGSDAAVAQSAVDRLEQDGHVTPAADIAIKILAEEIDTARNKGRSKAQGEKAVGEVDDLAAELERALQENAADDETK